MSLLRGIARPLLAAPLALDAIDALIHPDRHVAKLDALRPVFSRIEERGNIEDIDPYLSRSARISAGVTLLAAGAFALGKAPRTCAAVLTAIALPMAVINHELPRLAERIPQAPPSELVARSSTSLPYQRKGVDPRVQITDRTCALPRCDRSATMCD